MDSCGEWSVRLMGERNQNNLPDDLSYRDPDVLRELYHEKGLTSRQIAEQMGIDGSTVRKWMDRHDIERRGEGRPKWHRLEGPAHYGIDGDGYAYVQNQFEGESYHSYVHRLLAVAEYGYDRVVNNVVHHCNGVKWDNRPENIEVMTAADHARLHHKTE